MKPLLIACDFDGTITRRDTLHVIVEAYGTPGVWDDIEPRLRSGELTLEQAMQAEFAGVRATPEEVRELVLAEAPVRAGFVDLVEWTRREGHRLIVFSSGFRTVIDLVLERAGVEGLEILSHEAEFSADGCRLIWSERGAPCRHCERHCKRHDLMPRRRGEPLVYLGDGISDRCPALLADLLFARDGLAAYLDDEGVSYLGFEDFHTVRSEIERHAARLAAAA